MRRREFIALFGSAAAAWPLAARAQQSRRPTRLASFGPTLNSSPAIDQYEAFRTQLADLGFRDGQNVTIDYISVDNPRGPFVAVVDLMRS
jgi:putative ABC transport system substrate-binding protein